MQTVKLHFYLVQFKIHSALPRRELKIDFFVTSTRTIFANYKVDDMRKDISVNVSQSLQDVACFKSLVEINGRLPARKLDFVISEINKNDKLANLFPSLKEEYKLMA